ncbi:unnamed protein product, partial [Phaeothamnion confervicola]
KRRRREFEEEWATRGDEEVRRATQHAREWLVSEDVEAKYLLEKELKETRRRFFAPPRPETADLEKSLQDPANVIFAHVTHRLFQRDQTLRALFGQFDSSGDGYLSYNEFRRLVESLGLAALSGEQVHAVLRAVDSDGSGFIDLPELEAAMLKHETVCGSAGSPWKMYVHPIHAVMTFHNVQTDEEIWDYRATNEQLMRVVMDTLTGRDETRARAKAAAAKAADWEERQRQWAACVLQRGQRRWLAGRQRQSRAWRGDAEKLKAGRRREESAAATLQRAWRCVRARRAALLALDCTVEKICDPATLAAYYYNHATREASWRPPALLRRWCGPDADLDGLREWVLSTLLASSSYWLCTLTGEVRLMDSGPPVGYIMCGGDGGCQRPAVKACRREAVPLCFGCYRAAHVK